MTDPTRGTVMVPRDQRIQRAFRDPRPMAKRKVDDLRKIAADIRMRVEPGTTKEELAALLEGEATNYVPMRSLLVEQAEGSEP